MARAEGHEVVRLSPYHCEQNPIEMAWSQVKHYAKNEGFHEVTPQRWSDLIKHTHEKVEDAYFAADRLENWRQVEEFIIHVDEEDDEDEFDMEESDISDSDSSDDSDVDS
uniref:Tc1-like transposase DDE domain-containing protein n=1 Tax=Amphimedon queenslandica TaxID=400682 RepID=A0A1X7VKP6_AMPQE